MITHSIKVLDDREKAGFWFLVEKMERDAITACASEGIALDDIRKTSNKLKIIRDKTHFHLDKMGVIDPKAIWKKADVTNKEIEAMLVSAFKVMSCLYKKVHNQEWVLFQYVLRYDGSDATRIAEHADENNLLYDESSSTRSTAL